MEAKRVLLLYVCSIFIDDTSEVNTKIVNISVVYLQLFSPLISDLDYFMLRFTEIGKSMQDQAFPIHLPLIQATPRTDGFRIRQKRGPFPKVTQPDA